MRISQSFPLFDAQSIRANHNICINETAGHGWPFRSELRRRRMAPSIAAGRAGKARLFEHRDVRVRAGARPTRSAGQSSQPDVGETVMLGPWFWLLLPKQK